MHIWDNEMLMSWYVANEGAVRSKGTYFILHQHGINAVGAGSASATTADRDRLGRAARTQEEVLALMDKLRNDEKASPS